MLGPAAGSLGADLGVVGGGAVLQTELHCLQVPVLCRAGRRPRAGPRVCIHLSTRIDI